MLPQDARVELERRTLETFARIYRGDEAHRQCLRWAFSAAHALDRMGFRACMNAGTAEFATTDDLTEAINQYSYIWTPGQDTEPYLIRGTLPEIHAWAVIPDSRLIIDFTTRYLPMLVAEIGLTWKRSPPPPVGYFCADHLPLGYYYHAYDDACEFAYLAIEDALR